MTPVDVALSCVLGASIVLGLWRGLLYEVLALLAWVAAYFVARQWANPVAQWLPLAGWEEPWRWLLAFAGLFIATVFAGGLLAWAAQRGAQAVGLRPIDRTLGALFGAARGVLLLLALAAALQWTPWADHPQWEQAQGPRWLGQGLQAVKVLVPAPVAVYFP